MIRKIIDFFMTSVLFTIMFVISYRIIISFDIAPRIPWYDYFIIGTSMTFMFRLFGKLIGAKNV
jgi:hypothetical protein